MSSEITEPNSAGDADKQNTVSVGVIDRGHAYNLPSFDGMRSQTLTFMKRAGEGYPGNIGHYHGTNLQSVLRALIDRVLWLQSQIPCENNTAILSHLRHCLLELEQRAAERHGRNPKAISLNQASSAPMCAVCGHVTCGHLDSSVELAPDSDKGPCSQKESWVPIKFDGQEREACWLQGDLSHVLKIAGHDVVISAENLRKLANLRIPPSSDVTHGIEKEQDLRDAIEGGDNHDRDNPRPPQDEHDCFCIRCCAIRLLASVQKPEEGL